MVLTAPRQKKRALPGWTRLIEPLLGHVETKPGIGFAELQQLLATTPAILTRALQEVRLRELVRLRGTHRDARYYPGGPPVRLVGPVPTPLYPPLTAAERDWTEQRLGWLDYAMGKVLEEALARKILDALERDFRLVQPGVAANDPLARLLVEAIHTVGVIRRHRFDRA